MTRLCVARLMPVALVATACLASFPPSAATRERASELLIVLSATSDSGSGTPENADALCAIWPSCAFYRGLLDGWGTPFDYSRTAVAFTLRSAGRDKRLDTGDDIDFGPAAWGRRARELLGCWIALNGSVGPSGDTLVFSVATLGPTAMRAKLSSVGGYVGWTPWTGDSLRVFWVIGSSPRDLWLVQRGDTLHGRLRRASGEWGPSKRRVVTFVRRPPAADALAESNNCTPQLD